MKKFMVNFTTDGLLLNRETDAETPEDALKHFDKNFNVTEFKSVKELIDIDVTNIHREHKCDNMNVDFFLIQKQFGNWIITSAGHSFYINHCPFCGKRLN